MNLHELIVEVARRAETKRNKLGMDDAAACVTATFDVLAELKPEEAIDLFARGLGSAYARQQDAAVSD